MEKTGIWKSVYGDLVGLRNLENKYLLQVDIENKIKMHDHIRYLGRNITEEKSMPLRDWQQQTNNTDDLLERSSCVSYSIIATFVFLMNLLSLFTPLVIVIDLYTFHP